MDVQGMVNRISGRLKIIPPRAEIVKSLDTPTKLAAADPENGKIYVKAGICGNDAMFAVCHELRHCWQYRYAREMFDSYASSTELSAEEYNLQEAEIDANAFGMVVMVQSFGLEPQFAGMSEEVKGRIRNRAVEIARGFEND